MSMIIDGWLEIQLGLSRQLDHTLQCLLDLACMACSPLRVEDIDLGALFWLPLVSNVETLTPRRCPLPAHKIAGSNVGAESAV